MEERFIASMKPDPTDGGQYVFDRYVYRSRFRYRVWVTVPLGAITQVEQGALFASFYDELFLSFGDSQRMGPVQQNRVSGLLGYQFSDHGNVQLGYMLQTVQRPGAALGADLREMNNTLHLAIVQPRPPKTEGSGKDGSQVVGSWAERPSFRTGLILRGASSRRRR